MKAIRYSQVENFAPALEPVQAPPGTDEHLERDLVGLIGIQAEAPQRSVHLVGMGRHQRGERVLVAGAGAVDQLLLGHVATAGQARTQYPAV